VMESTTEAALPYSPAMPRLAEACSQCGSEYMISAKFCHICGLPRSAVMVAAVPPQPLDATAMAETLAKGVTWTRNTARSAAATWQKIPFPAWLRYLHFHEIKRWVGLPTVSLIAFMIGLGCVAGAIGVSLFYKASNFGEFQAIQLWRIEWLLGATTAFVAGILLKKPSGD
jgi:hypothetical protein